MDWKDKGVFAGYLAGEVWVIVCTPHWGPFCRQHIRGVVWAAQGESLSLMKSPSSSPENWLVGHSAAWRTRCVKGSSLISLSLPLCPPWTGSPHLTTSRLSLSLSHCIFSCNGSFFQLLYSPVWFSVVHHFSVFLTVFHAFKWLLKKIPMAPGLMLLTKIKSITKMC